MKTFKSIQKNQEQLNSLLMEKWGFKKKLEEGKGHDGSCDQVHEDMSHEEWEAKEAEKAEKAEKEEK